MFKQRCFRLLLLASAIAASLSAAAYDFESAGIYYNITGDNTVEVTYSDRDNNTYSGSVSVPETVTNNGTEYSVTKIGEYAFQGSAVTSVYMPESITSIGTSAFSGCQNLESVTLPESLTTFGSHAFSSCKSLKAIKIPSVVTTITDRCFSGCSSLESVTIPEGVTDIGGVAFFGCNLKALTLPESLEAIGSSAFYGNQSLKSVNIPAKVKKIEAQAFSHCGLTNLVIQEGVQTIGGIAFYENPLQKLTLPSTVTSIGGNAFGNNNNLQSIICNAVTPPTLGENAFGYNASTTVKVPLQSIAAYRQANGWKNFSNYCSGEVVNNGITYRIDENGATITAAEATLTEANILSAVEFEGNQYTVIKINDNVFADNTNLTAVTLPEGLVEIGAYAFRECKNLESVALPESLTTLGSEAFRSCKSLKAVKIPSGVTVIPSSCFSECSSLESVTIPEGVTTIEAAAFYYCNLNALTLPESLTTLGSETFRLCKSLKAVKIPSGVTAIPERCFSGCPSLESVTIPEGVTTIGSEAFFYSKIKELILPSTVAEIGRSAYTRIQSIVCNAVIPPVLGDNAFGSSVKDIKVPLQSIASYRKTYGWKDFSNYYGEEMNADGITYWINEKEAMVAVAEAALTEANILSSVEFEGNQYAVIKINDNVFAGNTNLTAVTLPEGLVEIGNSAFSGCQNFESVTLPESLTTFGYDAFEGCKSLRAVKIPSGVTAIPSSCFYECSSLESVTIPEGVTAIGSSAFALCNINTLILPSTVAKIDSGAFSSNPLQSVICNAVTPPMLGDGAFYSKIELSIKVPLQSITAYRQANGWKDYANYYGAEMVVGGITYWIKEDCAEVADAESSLTEANIPSAVEFDGNQYPIIKINDYVFAGNANLTTVTIEDGLVEIGLDAFRECKNLESVTLPESLITMGRGAFYGCTSLKTVKIPSNVTTIPESCFYCCSSLESVIIPEGVMSIGSFAFDSCNLKTLTLPESLTTLGNSAFRYNQTLKKVEIPSKVTEIPLCCFVLCSLLESVTIPEGVTIVGPYAFSSGSLKTLTLPSTVKEIGNNAFYRPKSIICNAVTPPMLGDNAFSSGIMSDVKVPLASIAAYRKAYGWKDFSNYYGGEEIIDGVAYRIDDKGAYVQAAIMTESEICLAENVAFEGAQYPLYKIADNAFAGNGSITLVTIPATVEAIGSNAFDGVTYPIIKIKATTPPVLASKLPMFSAIVPPASVKAYKVANYWKEMTIIGEGKNDIEVTTSATVDLTEAIMTQAKITPASVTSIKVHGPLTNDDIINALNTNMRSCYAIDLSDAEIEALPDEAFNGKIGLLEITLPAGLKAIGNNAFNGCFALRNEVTIPAGVETIGNDAFAGCKNAKFNPALPETLTAIGDYAFQNCANLYAVTLPASLQTIGDHAFEASNVQEAVLPAGLKTIGAYAFRKCSNITRVTLPDGLTTLGEGAFQQCEALVTADLMNPMEITSIPRYAFDGCSGLRNVYLPFFIETVGDYAFRGCASLRQIQFVAPTKTIGAYAFSGCRSLKSLNLPKSLETIGEYAFSGCQAISVISSPSLVPPTIANESALNGIDKDVCVLTMPKSVYLDYFRAPYWGQFVEYTASVLVGVDGQGSVMYSNNYGTAPTPVKVAAFYATAGDGDGVEEDEGDGITAEAYDSANICAKDNSTLTFRIVPDEGNEIKSVTYAGEDVTAQVVDGLFTTPVINGDTNLDVSFVASTDYIAIPASAVSKGAEVVVPVELVNTTEVMGIECKVQIPEGFSVAKKADGSLKVEQTERKADQTLTAAVDGNVLTVKTSGTQTYTGNTGAVFTIAIAPDEATAPADYVLKVTDVKFVNATGVASRPDAKTTLTLRDYVLGDVDSDQLVAINDAVIVMNHIVGADTPAFNAKAADMDGNGSVEINDAVLIMNTVVGTESTKSIKKTSATEPNADELTAADIEICQGGTAMLSLDLANLDALTAAQFEITLPEGITAGKAEAGERASRHMVKTNMVGNVLKVAMLSAESADFEGSEGAILVLPLSADKTMSSGSYGISLRNVKMSDARGNLFILPDTDSSVIVKDWSGVDSVAFDRLRVYGGNGEICIESPADTMIQIVAVDGRAFAVEASAGKTAVAVSAGVYVVNGQKVIVK